VDIEKLITQIQSLDGALKQEANKAVNRLLTIRNWLIGYYIVEYEQKGEDRAKYGDSLLQSISGKINKDSFSYRNLKLFRQFFLAYPLIHQILQNEILKNSMEIGQTPSAQLRNILMEIGQTPSAQFENNDNQSIKKDSITSDELNNNEMEIRQTLSDEFEKSLIGIVQTVPAQSYEAQLSEKIINKLSFSHITLLLPVNDPLKRAFYAIEAIKGTWSVRELKRQVNSLLFERSGLSKKPEQLLKNLGDKTEKAPQTSFVKDIYAFDFLGLQTKDMVEENDLETALLDHIQQFLLEMGHGFCLEGRQKRILIGNEYFFIDLVFYHRVLKCHVLVDLKVEEFNHNNAGQLNTYINYYKKEVQLPGDNAPVGILMVTNKNDALVEYATAGMDEKLFVRNYLLELPDKKEIEAFIKNELRTL